MKTLANAAARLLLLAVGIALGAPVAFAAVTITERTQVNLLRGSSVIETLPSWEACTSRSRALANADTRTTGTVTYVCQTERRQVIAKYAPDCPTQPAAETRVTQCPPGTTGTYQQTRTFSPVAQPTCWVVGEWSPTAPPSGACTPLARLQFSATAGGTYAPLAGATVSGSINVRLSECLPGNWAFHLDGALVHTEQQCPIALIADNHLYDTKTLANGTHRLEVRGSQTVEASFTVANAIASTGTATLSWIPPIKNTDGTPATVTAYRIHYGLKPDQLIQVVQIAPAATYTFTGLAPGTYFFAVRAISATVAESDLSNVASRIVG